MVALTMGMIAAPARATGHWIVLPLEKLTTNISLLGEKDTVQSLTVKNSNIKIECPGFDASTTLFPEGGGLAELKYSECSTKSYSGGETLPCETRGSKDAKGSKAVTVLVKTSLISHEGETYVLVSPHEGTTFVTLIFGGAECPFPESMPVTGSAVLKEAAPNPPATHLLRHLVEPAPQALFASDVVKFGKTQAQLEGSAWLTLTGGHAGMEWGWTAS